MPPPSLSKRHGTSGAGLKTALLAGLTLLLVGAICGALWWVHANRVEIDQATLCPKQGPVAIHAVLIDRSDPITPLQQTRVRQRMEEIVAAAPIGGRVAIYLAESDGIEALPPLLTLCNPGSEANPLYQNPRRWRERYELEFRQRIDTVLDRLILPSTRQTSPIAESLKALCIDAFGRAPERVPLKLTIISDMIQHSPVASHYRDRDYRALVRSPRLQALLADCKGAEAHVLYLLRPTPQGRLAIQTRQHQEFWDLFMQRINLRPIGMEPI